MDAFLRWLFDSAGDQSPTNPALFLATPTAYFAGAAITGTDLHQALAYLAGPNLIERLDTDPATVAITPEGVSCALSGGSVQDHTNPARTGTTYNNFLPNAQGVIIGDQQNVTQNNTAGIDPTAFVQLAGYVGQISPTLGMSDADRVELERVAQELHDEATRRAPSRAGCGSSRPRSRPCWWKPERRRPPRSAFRWPRTLWARSCRTPHATGWSPREISHGARGSGCDSPLPRSAVRPPSGTRRANGA